MVVSEVSGNVIWDQAKKSEKFQTGCLERLLVGRLLAWRLLVGRLLAGRLLAGRLLAGRLLEKVTWGGCSGRLLREVA